MEQNQRMRDFLRNVLGIGDPRLLDTALRYCYTMQVQKGQFLYVPGDFFSGPGFLMSGLLRICGTISITEAMRTEQFCLVSGQSVFPGWNPGTIPKAHVQALEDSEVLILPQGIAQRLLPRNLEAMQVFNRSVVANARHQIELQNVLVRYDATGRYEWFLERYPGLIDRVPHMYIASYLGMTPVTLSRIRNK